MSSAVQSWNIFSGFRVSIRAGTLALATAFCKSLSSYAVSLRSLTAVTAHWRRAAPSMAVTHWTASARRRFAEPSRPPRPSYRNRSTRVMRKTRPPHPTPWGPSRSGSGAPPALILSVRKTISKALRLRSRGAIRDKGADPQQDGEDGRTTLPWIGKPAQAQRRR